MRRLTAVSLGLFAAWAVHDVEELITYRETVRRIVPRLPSWVPVPEDIRRDGIRQGQVTTAIGMMSIFMGAAAVDGVRSQGRGWLFQTVLRGFGWHGIGHLAASALARSYTTGVATTPVVVLPYWLWARRVLTRSGVPAHAGSTAPVLLMYPLFAAVHALARRLEGRPR